MKLRLILMRHGQASWGQPGDTDHERPLTSHGLGQARHVGVQLTDLGWQPDGALVSDARRTMATWRGLAAVLGAPPQALALSELYDADDADLLELVACIGGEARTLMIMGHNPTQGLAVQRLCGQRQGFGEACAALLEAPAHVQSWEEVPAGIGEFELVEFLRP